MEHTKGCHGVRFEELLTFAGVCPACKRMAENFKENVAAAEAIMKKENV